MLINEMRLTKYKVSEDRQLTFLALVGFDFRHSGKQKHN